MNCSEPDRRPSFLDGFRLEHDVLCLEKLAFVIYNLFSPKFSHEFYAFSCHLDSFAVRVPLAVGLELRSVPARTHPQNDTSLRKYIHCSYHFRQDCRVPEGHWRNTGSQPDCLRLCGKVRKKSPRLDGCVLLDLQVFWSMRPPPMVGNEERVVTQRLCLDC